VNIKQVIVIRRDLGMRRGKEIAQGAHASIAWLTERMQKSGDPVSARLGVHMAILSPAEESWVRGNFRKICVVVNSEQELVDVYEKAKSADLVAELIEDTGLTEFHGEVTKTAVAIGPDYDEKIDPVTGDLKLY
jgi:peptidyl-tRNA hydrolase, PTH2 family